MRADLFLAVALPVVFAIGVTVHVAIALALFTAGPRGRALAALVLPPLAPLWAARAGMPRRAAAWIACLLAYFALRIAASR